MKNLQKFLLIITLLSISSSAISIISSEKGLKMFEVKIYGYSSTGGKDFAIFGVAENATYDFDIYWDRPEPPLPPSPIFILLYFYYPENEGTKKRLHVSYHPVQKNNIWILAIDLGTGGTKANVTLMWEVSKGGIYEHLYLKYNNETVNMYKTNQYIIKNLSSGKYYLNIIAKKAGKNIPAFSFAQLIIAITCFFLFKKFFRTSCILFTLSILMAAPVLAEKNFCITINFYSSIGLDNATFGIAENATEGFDPYWDLPQPPAPPTPPYIQAYFYYPNNEGNKKYLTKSFTAIRANISWPLILNVALEGPKKENVIAIWKPSDIEKWPPHFIILLQTEDGYIDMRKQFNYTYTNLSNYVFLNILAMANDTSPPLINNIKLSSNKIHKNGWINISCNIIDDLFIDKVCLFITYPSGDSSVFPMNRIGDIYYYNSSYSEIGEYEFYISASDICGNIKNSSKIVFTVYNRSPTISFIQGSSYGYIGRMYNYSVSANDPDEDRVRYYFDWGDGTSGWTEFFKSGTTVTISHKWNTPGKYFIRVKAQDIYGKESKWIEKTVTISSFNLNIPPLVDILFPSNNSTLTGTVIIKGEASDPDGIVHKVEVKINSNSWETAIGTTSWKYMLDTTAIANGYHVIYVRSYDGNEYSKIKKITVKVFNNNKPIIKIISPSNGSKVNGVVIIKGIAYDNDENDSIQKVEIKIGKEKWIAICGNETWTYTWNTKVFKNGIYNISVRAYDKYNCSNIFSIKIIVSNKKAGFSLFLILPVLIALLFLMFRFNLKKKFYNPLKRIKR